MPNGGSNSANFGMDVSVSDTAPSGFSGSYRIWPNFHGVQAVYNATVDANDAYSLGTEFTLSEACTLNNIWFYSPPTATQLPTQCAIWNVSTQTMVSGTLSTSPSWSGAAGSGWVSCSYTGITLPAGDYKTSVWNASASGTGTGWNQYTIDYFTTLAGASGITNGPITVPNVSSATSPGQSTYATSTTTFLYPDTYVATEGQSYWVDVEVTPSAGTSATASLAGAGALVADVQDSVLSALAGAGAFTGDALLSPGALLAGAASLVTDVTQLPHAALAGAASLISPEVSGTGGVLAGAGALAGPSAVQGSEVMLAGAAALTTAALQEVIEALAGSGSIVAVPAAGIPGTAALAGLAALGAPAVSEAPVSLAGSGLLSIPGAEQSLAVLAGAGAMVIEPGVLSAAALAGASHLSADAELLVRAVLAGSGLLIVPGPLAAGESGILLVLLP
jgi:hypothetical protein